MSDSPPDTPTELRAERSADSGRYSYEGLDRLIHERARLGILTSLAGRADGIIFSELKDLCRLTDGNLSRHLAMLAEGGLVIIWKGTVNNRPQTLIRIADEGRRRFAEYLNVLENVVADALSVTKSATKSARRSAVSDEDSPAGDAPAANRRFVPA